MTEKKTVKLPDLPTGKEFEEYISAYLQAGGYYLDRNIIDRGVEELLELDVIITDYNVLPRPKLIEIKSGGWGFSDIFKIKGWMAYTEISKGCFIVKDGKQNYEFYKTKAKEIGVRLYAVPKLENTTDYLNSLLKIKTISSIDIETLRYSFWLERVLLKDLKECKKLEKTKKSYTVLDQYYFKINSGVFFTKNLIDRIEQLYDNFKSFGLVTANCAHEIVGKEYVSTNTDIPKEIFNRTFYNCEYNILQLSTLFEYFSRLSILKNTVDYLLLRESKNNRKTEIKSVFFSWTGLTKLDFLPKTFLNGMEELSKHKYYNKYPIFWQWFLYVFGGFILLDYKEQEYKLLSEKTGIAIDEIDNVLNSLDLLFPTPTGWFNHTKSSNILELRLSSMPFRGIGANYRRVIYAGGADSVGGYEDLAINKYALADLIKWNNMTVELLSK